MAELAVAIAAARREWAGHAAALVAARQKASPFPFAEVALEGWLEHALEQQKAGEVEDRYRRELRHERQRAAAAGRTLAGPHLADLHVRHGPKQMPAENCSTGEQKALLIGLVLAQVQLATQLTGQTPLLLLDEVAAHLDEPRREALFALLEELGCQTFMTGTDMASFSSMEERVERLTVGDGRITRREKPVRAAARAGAKS
jgi:DNA replication and repair protein RecF